MYHSSVQSPLSPNSSSTAKHTVCIQTSNKPPLLIDLLSITGALLHHHGISVLSYFDQCSIAYCLAVVRDPMDLCTLCSKVCKIISRSSKKSALLYSLPLSLVPFSQSFDCIFPTEALNVVFKYNEFETSPHTGELTVC